MRPPEFTGGNRWSKPTAKPKPGCFNEAAGIHRRKLTAGTGNRIGARTRFNEAAGIHRRKPIIVTVALCAGACASMRPPEFTGGNFRYLGDPWTQIGWLQ